MSTDPTLRAVGPAVVIGPTVRTGTAEGGGEATVVSNRPQIADTATAPVDQPVMLVRGSDGLFRPDATTARKAAWSDAIRFRSGVPTDDPAAPEGAVYVDLNSGRAYRRREE